MSLLTFVSLGKPLTTLKIIKPMLRKIAAIATSTAVRGSRECSHATPSSMLLLALCAAYGSGAAIIML